MRCEKHIQDMGLEPLIWSPIGCIFYVACHKSICRMKAGFFYAAISGHWHAVSCLPQFCISPRQPFRKACIQLSLLLYCEYFILAAAARMPSVWPANAMQRALCIFKGKHTSNNHSCFQLGGFLLWEHGTCALCTYRMLTDFACHARVLDAAQTGANQLLTQSPPGRISVLHSASRSLNQSIPC